MLTDRETLLALINEDRDIRIVAALDCDTIDRQRLDFARDAESEDYPTVASYEEIGYRDVLALAGRFAALLIMVGSVFILSALVIGVAK